MSVPLSNASTNVVDTAIISAGKRKMNPVPVPQNGAKLTGPTPGASGGSNPEKGVEVKKGNGGDAMKKEAISSKKDAKREPSSPKSQNKNSGEEKAPAVGAAKPSTKKTSPWDGNHDTLRSVVGGTTRVVATNEKVNETTPVKPRKKRNVHRESPAPGSTGSSATRLRADASDFTPNTSPQKSASPSRGGHSPVEDNASVLLAPPPSATIEPTTTISATGSVVGKQPKALRSLMVNFVPMSVKAPEFRDMFEAFGAIAEANLMCDKKTGQSKGYGFVEFWSSYSAMTCIQEMDGFPYKGKKLKVRYADHQGATMANTFIANNPAMVLLGVGLYSSGPPEYGYVPRGNQTVYYGVDNSGRNNTAEAWSSGGPGSQYPPSYGHQQEENEEEGVGVTRAQTAGGGGRGGGRGKTEGGKGEEKVNVDSSAVPRARPPPVPKYKARGSGNGAKGEQGAR